MNGTVRQVRDFFVSLKLTVVLLSLSILLIFAATLAQVNLGIWAVQQEFFHSFIAIWHVGPLFIPLPGGYLIGGLLLINLVTAHVYRFRMSWKKSGVFLVHAGLIVLLVGELLTGLWQEDSQMRILEGETKNHSESFRHNELALIEITDPKTDHVVVVPEEVLAREDELQHPQLPFRVVTKQYHPNAILQLRANLPPETPPAATAGVGPRLVLTPVAVTYKQDERNAPAAIVELIGPEGSLGTWVVSTYLPVSQVVEYAGRAWRIGLRFERTYLPFSLKLLEVKHDVYLGTDIPKNFSSRVQLTSADGSEDREVLIFMNNPLRHGGLTFYQYQMDSANATTVLQVVRNPSWLLPYVSCAMMTLGLLVQFGIHLVAFVNRRRAAAPI